MIHNIYKKNKYFRKVKTVLTMLLAISITFTLVPNLTFSVNAAIANKKSIMVGTSAITVWDKDDSPTSLDDTDKIIFGTLDSKTVPWVMIHKDETNKTGLVLSEYVLRQSNFDTVPEPYVTDPDQLLTVSGAGYYSDSDNLLKPIMDSLYDVDLGLTSNEKTVVANTTLTKESMHPDLTSDFADQKFFPLSYYEFRDYVGKGTPLADEFKHIDGNTSVEHWWLRSQTSAWPGITFADSVAEKNVPGIIEDNVWSSNVGANPDHGVRPAFNVNLSSLIFASSAKGSKVDTKNDSNMTAVADASTNEWKMTILDTSHTLKTAKTSVLTAGKTSKISYTGASVGHVLSAMVVDKNTDGVLYYANLDTTTSQDGTVEIMVPSDYDNFTQKIVLFTETLNGDDATDYSSNLIEVIATDKNMMLGIDALNIVNKNSLGTSDKLIFGTINTIPVPWVLIDESGLMFSQYVLQKSAFSLGEDADNRHYPNGELNSVMQDLYNTDLGLSSMEQSAIKDTILQEDSMFTGLGHLENQKFFPLSYDEFYNYVQLGNSLTKDIKMINNEYISSWWFRTSGKSYGAYNSSASRVSISYQTYTHIGVRPAFNLDENNILFMSAAVNGKNDAMDSDLTMIENVSPNEWKMTVKDGSHTLKSVELSTQNAGEVAKATYTGASIGHTLSAMIIDQTINNIIYYGKIGTITSESGTFDVTIPSNFDSNSSKIVFFTETLNGDNQTDFASDMVESTLYVPTPTPEPTTKPTTKPDKDDSDSTQSYRVKITGGKVTNTYYQIGERVKIKADEAEEGMIFDKWVVEEGDIEIKDINDPTTSFKMVEEDVKLIATYKAIDAEPSPEPTETPETGESATPETGDSIAVMFLLMAMSAVCFLVLKTKKAR